MKLLFSIPVFLLIMNVGLTQEIHYQTLEAQMKITASRDGEIFQWENKHIVVSLDYKNGNFLAKLNNKDFNKTMGASQPNDSDTDRIHYEFKGIFPINEILKQNSINQTYPIELRLVCESLDINQTHNFQMDITKPGSGSVDFRIFTLHGKLFNDEVQIPALETYDNEVELWIIFNAMGSN